jgi:hypothetical protein
MQSRSDLERWRPDTFHKIIFTLLFLERSSKEWSHTDVFFTGKSTSRHNYLHFFGISTSKKVHNNWFFLFGFAPYWSQRAYFSIPSYCTNPRLILSRNLHLFFLTFSLRLWQTSVGKILMRKGGDGNREIALFSILGNQTSFRAKALSHEKKPLVYRSCAGNLQVAIYGDWFIKGCAGQVASLGQFFVI